MRYGQRPDGLWLVEDTRSGKRALARDERGIHEFAAAAAAAPGYAGAGDMVARMTGALGIQKCAPCAERQAALNRMMPRVWRR